MAVEVNQAREAVEALLAAVGARLAALPWPAPWVAHTFEVECPYPDGCGDPHTCEEVASPSAYPDGQVVAQIVVPGLERFAAPVAAFIAEAPTDVALLCAALREALAREDALRVELLEARGLAQVYREEHDAAKAEADALREGPRVQRTGEGTIDVRVDGHAHAYVAASSMRDVERERDAAVTRANDMHRRAQRNEGAAEQLARRQAAFKRELDACAEVIQAGRRQRGSRALAAVAAVLRDASVSQWGERDGRQVHLSPAERVTVLVAQRDEARLNALAAVEETVKTYERETRWHALLVRRRKEAEAVRDAAVARAKRAEALLAPVQAAALAWKASDGPEDGDTDEALVRAALATVADERCDKAAK